MLCCAFLQHVNRKVLTLLRNVIEVLVEVLDLVGVLLSLEGVVQTLLHGVVLFHVLGLLEGHGAVGGTRPGLEQLDLLQVILVQSSRGVGRQAEASSVQQANLEVEDVSIKRIKSKPIPKFKSLRRGRNFVDSHVSYDLFFVILE